VVGPTVGAVADPERDPAVAEAGEPLLGLGRELGENFDRVNLARELG
jgi:hypothetical protein